MNRRETLDTPADIEPGYTMHKFEDDIEFLLFTLGDTNFDAFVELAIWKAKRKRDRDRSVIVDRTRRPRPVVIDHIQEPH
jgi:hypothetical protein